MIRIFLSTSSRERLDQARSFLRALPPGSEAIVMGATREAADDLVREWSASEGATFGLRRWSFTQLVAHLALEGLAARRLAPTTALGAEAVAMRAAFEAEASGGLPRFGPMLGFPRFPRALAATLGELRLATLEPGAIDAGGAEQELRTLARGFDQQLTTAGLADRSRLLELATEALSGSRQAWIRATPVLALDVSVEHRAEGEFLRRLLSEAPRALATLPEGDDLAIRMLTAEGAAEVFDARDPGRGAGKASRDDGSLSRLRRFVFSKDVPTHGGVDGRVRLFSAPGEARECVEIVRQIQDEARAGTPFDAMAVLVRSPELYADYLETAFRRAEIPVYFTRGTRRPDPSGRAFLALLACRAEGLSARRFAEYLSFAEVPDLGADGAPVPREVWLPPEDAALGPAAVQLAFSFGEPRDPPPPAGGLETPWKWEEYLVEAAVIGGRDRWERRLRGLEAELGLQHDRLAADEPDSPRLVALERDLARLGNLQRFALPVIAALDRLPQAATWGAWIEALEALAPLVLRHPERVLAMLAELRPMREVGPVTIEEVRVVLAPRLGVLDREPPRERHGRVFIGTPEHARGRSFRVVFVPGLAERLFPQRPREDPLLPDAARRRTSEDLATQDARSGRERLRLRLAIGAAEERVVLSYPRMDVSQARPRVPSFYGLDVMRAVRGALPRIDELERGAAMVSQARLAWPAPDEPERAIDALEHDLAVLGPLFQSATPVRGRARYLLELNPHLARSLRSRWVRGRERWVPQDGLVRVAPGTAPILASHRPRERAYSVTSLERFAVCPYQFLLSAILRLEPRREAAALIQLDPLTRGSMIHDIQAEVLRQLVADGRIPLTRQAIDPAAETLERVVDEVAGRYFDDLAPAIPRVWDDELTALRGDLRIWLRRLADDATWVPRHVEHDFGRGAGAASPRKRGQTGVPVEILDGYRLHGAIDLIEERSGAEALRITDYKTGANHTSLGVIVGGGEILQPVLYGLAAQSLLQRPVEEARLYYCTSRGGFTEHKVPMSEFARHYGKQVLDTIDQSIATGALPPAPRAEACASCDFRPVCGPGEEQRWKRKQPRLTRELVELRELP